jgi:diguanylate cyclase (GGDEF)-like protein
VRTRRSYQLTRKFRPASVQESRNPRASHADHFKQLNDRHGHAAGDTALAVIGSRLTEWAGRHGVAGRLGGDEFAALARIEPRHQALRLEHLARLMTRPVPYGDGLLPLTVSLGAATPGRRRKHRPADPDARG